jgi:site-specific recombinase XerD
LEKTASMMLEFQEDGKIEWRRRRRRPALLPPCFEDALRRFEAASRQSLSPGSVKLLVQGARQLMAHLGDGGHADFGRVGLDDVRAFLVSAAPRHQSGMGNVVWMVKRLFAFLNGEGLSGLRVDAMLSRTAPRRVPVLPPFTLDEVGRLLAVIDTGTSVGKRDYAMVRLAVSTGLRLGDITVLRLADIDWRRDEIRVVQHKTAIPVVLPLTADAGNAIADYLLDGRPASRAPEVFLRAYAPFTRLTGTTGALIMGRYLGKAGIDHQAGDGKTFHALRRTVGTRLVETGAGLPMAAQILGHARIDSSKRYIGLDVEALRECCLPLAGLECRTEALR